jgi:glycosyltransferase involved in cell wall biosynthesis
LQFDVLCHSHLRWDFVWQRPQHLMTRLARRHRVIYLEDALPLPEEETTSRLDVRETPSGVIVARPLLERQTGDPEQDKGVDERNGTAALRLIREELERRQFDPLVHWIYTPMAYPLARQIPFLGIVYDCMDELSLFKNPPPGIVEREKALLDCADLVFTGGRSLYQGKAERHPNVHMFASGVEVEHFDRACAPETFVPEDMASIPRPRLTYIGVIDERIDLDLIRETAQARPNWQLVMIGPVVKLDESLIPRLPNIHCLGQKPYADLPGYLKGSDVAIMPFAMNDATRYISPTKTLEYMAARRPIVSTPIADVVAYYTEIVWIGASPAEFIQACEQALSPDPSRLAEGVAVAKSQTWDSIGERMNAMLEATIKEKGTGVCSTTR